MTEAYHLLPGLSFSGMKDLSVSPLRYWYLHLNPEKPEPVETPEMRFGSALHCAVLEPREFDLRYACEYEPDDKCLVTIEDLRTFLRNCERVPKGTRKAELIAQVQDVSLDVKILEVEEQRHAVANAGRTLIRKEDWTRLCGCAEALSKEPKVVSMLATGTPEAQMFADDPETGVKLRSKLDWKAPSLTLDLKTFSQQRSKSIDKSVADAMFYEGYLNQAWFYTYLRFLNGEDHPRFVFAFVESEPPFEVRIKQLRAMDSPLYWSTAGIKVRSLIDLYATCLERYGPDKPWRDEQQVEPLCDEEIPQLAY